VLLGEPLNFANVIRCRCCSASEWRSRSITSWPGEPAGPTAAINPDARVFFQRADDGDGVRQPMALRPAGHFEHGQAHGLALVCTLRRGSVPAGPELGPPRGDNARNVA